MYSIMRFLAMPPGYLAAAQGYRQDKAPAAQSLLLPVPTVRLLLSDGRLVISIVILVLKVAMYRYR
jgi:hypothetical protein